jgi:hypothetical protein
VLEFDADGRFRGLGGPAPLRGPDNEHGFDTDQRLHRIGTKSELRRARPNQNHDDMLLVHERRQVRDADRRPQ